MKIISGSEMARIEALAIKDGALGEDFMEKAGRGIADLVQAEFTCKSVILLTAKGNNGGDAYVAGSYLLDRGYTVHDFPVGNMEDATPLCKKMRKRFLSKGGGLAKDLTKADLIIDGLLGTGLKGEVQGKYLEAIYTANGQSTAILSIDVPSGLSADTGEVFGSAIVATATASLGLPKKGFFIQQGWNHVGKLYHVDFGLSEKSIERASSNFELLLEDHMARRLPVIFRSRHKYQAGAVAALAGSLEMPGAAMLSCLSALRSGAGIVKCAHPKGATEHLANSFYELIHVPYSDAEDVIDLMNSSTATLMGPGLGQRQETLNLLREVFPKICVPAVLDADALNLVAKDCTLNPPKGSILTPHLGEMRRLLGKKDVELEACRQYALKKNITLVVKGAPTFIFSPDHPSYVSPWGTPGMATAGSGDVLTGIIASLLAQKLSPIDAAILGCYLHGRAGELATIYKTDYCIIASDIIGALPNAFCTLKS